MNDLPTHLQEIGARWMSIAGGFLGGTSLMVYLRPTSFGNAVIRAFVSTASAAALTHLVASKVFGVVDGDPEIYMGIAFGIGFVAWSMLGAVAQFFENRKGQDAVEIIKGVKDGISDKH